MAQDVAVAGLGSPLTPTRDPSAGLISEAGAAVSRFRQGSLEDRVRRTADTAAELADETRTQLVAQEGSTASRAESAALLQTAEGLTAEELLSGRERQVTEEANRVFGRYRRALGQGATNASAARISVEKEMQDMISANPAFADSIRTAAARAMGQTEFQLLTSDRPAGTEQTQSQFAKDRASALDAVDQQAAIMGWSETYKNARANQVLLDLSRKYQIENSNQFFSESATFDENTAKLKANQVREKAQLRASEILNVGLDALDQQGGEGGIPIIGEQQLANLRVSIQSEMASYRQELEGSFPDTMDPARREELIASSMGPLNNVMSVLQSNRASEVLQGIRQAQQLGTEMTMTELMPYTMAMNDAFGQNAELVMSKYSPEKLSQLAFWNSAPRELQEMVRSGRIQRSQIPDMFQDMLRQNLNAATTGDPETNWRMVGSGYLAPMSTVDPSARGGDTRYGEMVETTAAMAPVEVQKQIVGTPQLDKFQKNVVKTWSTAVDNLIGMNQERVRSRSTPDQGRDTYVMATVGSDNRIKFMEYTAVLGTDPDTGEDVWRIQGRRPLDNLSEGVSRLTNRYGVGNGRSRSVLGHPQLNQGQFGGMSEEEYVETVQDRINSNRDAPEWLSGQAGVSNLGVPRQENISEGRVSGFFRAVGNATSSLFTSAEEARTQGAAQAEPVDNQRVTVARIKNAVNKLERGEQQPPSDRALATIYSTPNAEDLGVTQDQLNRMSEEERYRLIAEVINQRMEQ